jgi:type I restriction enzyme S subunit
MNKIEKLIEQYCPNGVESRALGEVTNILNGYSFKSTEYSKEGIRVIRISDVQKGRISNKDLKFYPKELHDEISRYILKKDDLVMSLTGNTGSVAIVN